MGRVQASKEDDSSEVISISQHQAPPVAGFFAYRHLGLAVRTFTLLCNNSYPKEGAGRKWQGV